MIALRSLSLVPWVCIFPRGNEKLARLLESSQVGSQLDDPSLTGRVSSLGDLAASFA